MATKLPDAIKIRHAVLTDVDSFRELRLEAIKNHPTAFGQDYDENILRPQGYWGERLTINSAEQALFFAEYNEQLVGMTGIFRQLSKKSLHSAGVWGVYVKPEWRGRYISETLIQSCLNWAKQQNIVIVKLAVVTSNLSALHCYKRCGFTIYGKEPKALYVESKYYDEYLMSIEIGNK
jgi:RimJ/RimL family protein N-acetyltransferase